MKKLNVKTIVIFGVLAVVMVLMVVAVGQVRTFMSGASSDVEPKNVTAVPGSDGKSVTITWTSDKESISKVEYGTTAASLVLMSAEVDATTSHNLSLSSLRPATTYYYRIRIGEEVFDSDGIPYTFKTKTDATAIPSVVPTTSTPGTKTVTVCDTKTDYNKDGTVNSFDVLACKKDGGSVTAVSDNTVVATPTTKKTTSTTPTISCTGTIPDYNSDGIINSLDRVNCLQSQK
jgi:hypothetical protein